MRRVLATAAALSLLAGGAPALAASKAKGPKYGVCKAPAGAFLVKPGKPLTLTPTTPVGGLFLTEPEAVGDFYLDLSGRPVTPKKGNLSFSLDWDTPAEGDYDLVIDGTGTDGTDQPEVADVSVRHCSPVDIGISVFVGTPLDTLTLTVTA